MTCYTIGHSNHSMNEFISIVKDNQLNCIIDVRSSPYSKYASHFNRESLSEYLKREGIRYIFMGDSLGARYENENLLFPSGKVDFSKVVLTQEFINGISRVIDGIQKGFRIALVCSEKNPFDCHRFVLVSKNLKEQGIEENVFVQKVCEMIYRKEDMSKLLTFLQKTFQN